MSHPRHSTVPCDAPADRLSVTHTAAFVVPGRLDERTGGYLYDRFMIEGLRQRGWSIDVVEVPGRFPDVDPATAHAMRSALARLPDASVAIVDGLAFSAVPDVVVEQSPRLRFVAIVHMPLADDVGLMTEARHTLEARERRALQAASLVVVTGESTRRTLGALGVPAGRIASIGPGTAPAPLATGSRQDRLELLCVATINAGKGHILLIDSLAQVASREWHLTCAGSLTRDPTTVVRVRERVASHHLGDHVTFVGELGSEDLARAYDRSDLFVLATVKETYGMAVAEALARGLPVISTPTGAIPALVGSDAGILVEPADQRALVDALTLGITDAAVRQRWASGARRARERLPSWDEAFDKMAAALEPLYG
jgi:glycosyltransferase involved in cell wall biosynthesis